MSELKIFGMTFNDWVGESFSNRVQMYGECYISIYKSRIGWSFMTYQMSSIFPHLTLEKILNELDTPNLKIAQATVDEYLIRVSNLSLFK